MNMAPVSGVVWEDRGRKEGVGGEEAGAGTEMGCRGECTVGILAEDRRKVISSWALLAGVALASMGR